MKRLMTLFETLILRRSAVGAGQRITSPVPKASAAWAEDGRCHQGSPFSPSLRDVHQCLCPVKGDVGDRPGDAFRVVEEPGAAVRVAWALPPPGSSTMRNTSPGRSRTRGG